MITPLHPSRNVLLLLLAGIVAGCGGSGGGADGTGVSPVASATAAPTPAPVPPPNACAASIPGNGIVPYPTDTAALPIVNGLYQRPETSIALVGPNDGVANAYSDPFPGSLGGRYLLFYNSSHVTLTGRGYILMRWEYAYFNRGGVLDTGNAPTVTAAPGSTIKKVALAARYMPDDDMDGIPGKSGVWRPGNNFTPITIVGPQATSGWQNEYFYVDGQVTFANHESGADYNVGITPVTFASVGSDVVGTAVGASQVNYRPGRSLDPYAGDVQAASPVNLSATVASDARVELRWSDCSADARGYLVEYSYAGTFGDAGHTKSYAVGDLYTTGASLPSGATAFSLAKLQPSTTYAIRVKAYDAAVDSAYSNVVQVTTPAAGRLPSPWQEADIFPLSTPLAVPGTSSALAGNVTLRVGSGDITGTADSFHLVYRTLTGDGTLTARVVGLAYTNQNAKAGVMIRDGLSPGAANMMTTVTAKGTVGNQYRSGAAGGTSAGTAQAIATDTPWWLRVNRAGNVFTSESSADGVNWTLLGTRTINMATTVDIGLATSSLSSTATTATFDSVGF